MRYGPGAVIDRLDFDASCGEMAGVANAECAGKAITVGCIQRRRRPAADALRVLGHYPVSGAAQLRPLIGGQLRHSALPDGLRAARALDLFATPRARDGTELLEWFGLGKQGRWRFSSHGGREQQLLFLMFAPPGRSKRTP
jgi:ABC-2 type transport system ATP-binding protein